uniref:GRAS7 n=1 Tax=Tamarix hispida TaxID=189793 RepID=A0A2S1WLP0_9CARY|nr:GRAS7 [Tamarix hispida]
MDSRLEELYWSVQGINFNDPIAPTYPCQKFLNRLRFQKSNSNSNNLGVVDSALVPPLDNSMKESFQVENTVGDHDEDYDFSDVVLKHINQVLMEDDVEERVLNHAPSALEATEKSLYDVIGEQYPPPQSLDRAWSQGINYDAGSKYGCASWGPCSSSSKPSADFVEHGFSGYVSEYDSQIFMGYPDFSKSLLQSSSNSYGLVTDVQPLSSHSTSSSGSGVADERADSPTSTKILNDNESILQFEQGVKRATRFLPDGILPVGLGNTGALTQMFNEWATAMVPRPDDSYEDGNPPEDYRSRKHRHSEDSGLEDGRVNKQPATSDESVLRSELFDMVLLCNGGKNDAVLREALRDGLSKHSRDDQQKATNGGKGRGKRREGRRDLVDLRSLLTLCAQAVGSNDQRNANELLKQIKEHSSPTGDGNQRMAHYFANGLEARLAGVGTPIYTFVISGQTSAADFLRAYHLFLAMCPFKKLSNCFSNRTIIKAADKAKTVHIIDFGILYGFQWPCLMQRLSKVGGPPKLRITGIDLPQPGFRPAKRVEETGHRLKNYADSFNVPFEFIGIAKKWDLISIEDLKVEKDEVVVVNSLYRLKYLPDETVLVESPRNIVLNLIKKLNPHVFIQGIVNGAYNAPFFTTRFREALFNFSTLFDMLETNVPRDSEERILLEREIFGRQAMNVIACEGTERVERPETYRQWQARNERAGFRPLPLNREIVDMAKDRVKTRYHKDFMIDEDGAWLLQGWKGRILYAISCWEPDH